MKLGIGVGIHYDFEMEQDVAPSVGDSYRDPRGHLWVVREVGPERGIKLRDPPARSTVWTVRLAGEHVAYRLSTGEVLEPEHERRFNGDLRREGDAVTGFGNILRGSTSFSWILRAANGSWVVRVGPSVNSYNSFHTTLFERSGMHVPEPGTFPWDVVTGVLDQFHGA